MQLGGMESDEESNAQMVRGPGSGIDSEEQSQMMRIGEASEDASQMRMGSSSSEEIM